jgi:tripartite-type tricarboxylate transporter receptor subunit TctC
MKNQVFRNHAFKTLAGATFAALAMAMLVAPAGTPPAIVQRLHAEVDRIVKQPDVRERFAKLGIEPGNMSSREFADFQKAEIAKWSKVVKEAKLKVD